MPQFFNMARAFVVVFIAFLTLSNVIESRILDGKIEKEMEDLINKEDATKVEQKADLFEGDIMMDKEEQEALDSGKLEERDAVNIPMYRWPHGILYYKLHRSLSKYTRRMIHKAFKHIELHTCVRFHKYCRNSPHHYVMYFTGRGCYSRIGRSPKKNRRQLISIGHGCERLGTIVHETMHALGFFHEQSRPDRDKYVRIVWDQI
ncbi:zinc metalloproteinase nas-4, partial [Exaiptasia diaphana]|uniref:Metalloendopeptidase n=1 Tax=Exaiptasia diaphana TaxID=2652724 RepID=A0A913YH47_EXADI